METASATRGDRRDRCDHRGGDRPALDAIDWEAPVITTISATDAVTVTWLGVTTLLFDDGDTQLLIDGFFSRPSLTDILLDRPVDNDAAIINYALDEFRMRRLAAPDRSVPAAIANPASRIFTTYSRSTRVVLRIGIHSTA